MSPPFFWYTNHFWARVCSYLLLPLSCLFDLISSARRIAYRYGLCTVTRVAVPVIVVGNICVGGTGKTPLTIAIIEHLKREGWQPAVISRGYGRHSQTTLSVTAQHQALEVGDEPLLIHQRTGVPVVVARSRVHAAQYLLAQHPHVNIIVSDDGLQHYALARDIEIVLIGTQGLGNGYLLPAGPLREKASRLAGVDLRVCRQPLVMSIIAKPVFSMQITGDILYNLHTHETRAITDFYGRSVTALAGIGQPQVFFQHLRAAAMQVTERVFPDHHCYTKADFIDGDTLIVMTEKDAVKCRSFAPKESWVLPINAQLPPPFWQQLKQRCAALPQYQMKGSSKNT